MTSGDSTTSDAELPAIKREHKPLSSSASATARTQHSQTASSRSSALSSPEPTAKAMILDNADKYASSGSDESRDNSDSGRSTPLIASAKTGKKGSGLRSAKPTSLFNELPSKTEEAKKTFEELMECTYGNKYLGDAGQEEIMTCDCRESWDGGKNTACDEFSDCINRMTSMECVNGECNCGDDCQNQRFQRKEYAPIDIIRTDMKGYGMRACANIKQGTFIYEYIGEVIDEGRFRKRMLEYDEQGIKHFYFMMLQKGEFVDATQKGCLARFCNHSCNPNCFVDKWVVKNKLKMGIFAKRDIIKGEEITFDYNVDRYGAQAQPCYCGEPNCIGFIGGKTQTESASKLPQALADALGLSDDEDDWATVAPKRKRKQKVGEDDEEYVSTLPTRPVKEESVSKIMSSLLQCKEKWLVSKLLKRIHMSEDQGVQRRVMQMHGYQILGTLLRDWKTEDDIIILVLEILSRWPRMTRNKISSSKIENTVQELAKMSEHERIKTLASELCSAWESLEMAYRIPRRERPAKSDKKPEAAAAAAAAAAATESSQTPDRPASAAAPEKTPKSERFAKSDSQSRTESPAFGNRNQKQFRQQQQHKNNNNNNFRQQQQQAQQKQGPSKSPKLHPDWAAAEDPNTKQIYYYNQIDNRTQWEFPAAEVAGAETGSRKQQQQQQQQQSQQQPEKFDLQKIIDEAQQTMAEKMRREEEMKKTSEAKAKVKDETNGHRRHKEHHKDHHHKHHKHHSHNHTSSSSSSSKPEKSEASPAAKDGEKQKDAIMLKIRNTFAKHVPNMVKRYEKEFGRDGVKKYSKEIVQILIEKEMRVGKHIEKNASELTGEKKKKIDEFVTQYMDKVVAKKRYSGTRS